MLAGGLMALLWIAVIWFPVGGLMLEGVAVVVGGCMALFALIAAIAAWHAHAAVIFVCFVASFFGVGAFALNVDHWFRVFGLLDLLLLLASVMIWYSKRAKETKQ
jgi:hypothetical protein